jgi:beta-phosphoglucomutase
MRYLAFIFDMDGTLVDNMGFHTRAWSAFVAAHGMPMSDEELHRKMGGTIDEVIRSIFGDELIEEEVVRLGAEKEALYRQMYAPHLSPVPGLLAFLKTSSQLGIRRAIATSGPRLNMEFTLAGLDLDAPFDVTLCGDDVTRGKPDPEIFLRAAEMLQVAPEKCLVFEDSPVGAEAARRAGMQILALSTTYPAAVLAANPAVLRVEADFVDLRPHELLECASANYCVCHTIIPI